MCRGLRVGERGEFHIVLFLEVIPMIFCIVCVRGMIEPETVKGGGAGIGAVS